MPLTLPYSSLPSTGHVAIERDPHHFRMTVPPNPSLRALPRSYALSLIFLLFLFVSHLLNFVHQPPQLRWEIAPAFIIDLVGGILLFSLAYARTHRWSTFEITTDRFRLISRIFTSEYFSLDLARDDLLELRLNRYNGKLLVRAQRREMQEFFITPNQHDTQNIIDTLREALTFTFEPVQLSAPAQARPTRPPRTDAQKPRTKIAILLIALAIIVHVFIFPVTLVVLAIGAVIAAIPLGIRYGTQQKDFYP
jgi:hypothetical protein